MTTQPTPEEWLARWEAQQGGAAAALREQRFAALVAVVEALAGPSPQVLDLGCGPGSVADRILDRLPEASVVGVDADPVLIELGHRAHPDDGRMSFVDADLTDADWPSRLPDRHYDAVTSTTALHWLDADALTALYRQLANVVRPGGVFLNGDVLSFDDEQSRIAAAAAAVRAQETEPVVETWTQWWEAIAQDPSFAESFAERARRRHSHPDHRHVGYRDHVAALRAAGFAEVDTVWQVGDNRLLVAVR